MRYFQPSENHILACSACVSLAMPLGMARLCIWPQVKMLYVSATCQVVLDSGMWGRRIAGQSVTCLLT